MNKIRETLGDSADHPRFVETLSRRGYRFIGKITDASAHGAPKSIPLPSDMAAAGPLQTDIAPSGGLPLASRQSPKYDFRPVLVLSAAMAALALVLAVGKPGGARATTETANIKSIAVLPFENLSGNPADQYFADGMTDELITELAKSKGLRIISRTSVMQYKGVHRPVKDVARELGVDGILEGSVLVDHARVRVSVQLVHAPSDTPIWARSYIRDENDLLLLQQDLAESVAKEVDGAALPSKPSTKGISPAAHDAYLRGRFDWFKGNNETARGFFEKAIQLQPDYAAAYSGLADYYIAGTAEGILVPHDALPKGEALARRALDLDDSSPDTHNTMAALYLFYLWNWTVAEKESKKSD